MLRTLLTASTTSWVKVRNREYSQDATTGGSCSSIGKTDCPSERDVKTIVVLVALLWCFCGLCAQTPEQAGLTVRLSSPEQIGAEFNSIPCDNADRLPGVRALFERMGA